MSLLYDADGDKFVSTSAISAPTAGTTITWFYPTSDTARQTVYIYQGDGGSNGYADLVWRADLAGDYFAATRERGAGATQILVQANAANYSVYGLNKWLCLVFRWDTAGANSDQRLWMGDETTAPAAPSSYTTQSAGSGASSTTAGVCTVGASNVSTTRWLRGRVGFHALFSTALSDADMNAVCAGVYWGSPTHWWLPGRNGTTDVPEIAGGNTGVITGLSSPDFAPGRYFVKPLAFMGVGG